MSIIVDYFVARSSVDGLCDWLNSDPRAGGFKSDVVQDAWFYEAKRGASQAVVYLGKLTQLQESLRYTSVKANGADGCVTLDGDSFSFLYRDHAKFPRWGERKEKKHVSFNELDSTGLRRWNYGVGYPFISRTGMFQQIVSGGVIVSTSQQGAGKWSAAVRPRVSTTNVTSTRVQWIGAATNVALLATGIFFAMCFMYLCASTLIAGFRAIGARSRIRRGRCVRCGYSLRGLMVELCPECGGVTSLAVEAEKCQ